MRVAAAIAGQELLGVTHDDGEKVVEVVRDTASQASDNLLLLGFGEQPVLVPELFLRLHLDSHVEDDRVPEDTPVVQGTGLPETLQVFSLVRGRHHAPSVLPRRELLRGTANGGLHAGQVVRLDHFPELRRVPFDLLGRDLPNVETAGGHVLHLIPAVGVEQVSEDRARHVRGKVVEPVVQCRELLRGPPLLMQGEPEFDRLGQARGQRQQDFLVLAGPLPGRAGNGAERANLPARTRFDGNA